MEVLVDKEKEEESVRLLFPVEFGELIAKQPEAKLWAYCLNQAIAIAVGARYFSDNKYWRSRAKYLRSMDRFWLVSDRRRYVGSCAWICDMLGVDRKELIRHVFRNRHTLKRNPYVLRIQYNDQ